jgi:hypothetical protein
MQHCPTINIDSVHPSDIHSKATMW